MIKNEAIRVLQAKKPELLEKWIRNQLENEGLRNDLISNEEQQSTSDEVLSSLLRALNDKSLEDPQSRDFEKLNDLLTDISMSRAKQGFSPRETGVYISGLKQALLYILQMEIRDPALLYSESLKINKLLDNFGIAMFEVFIKGREDVILRQNNEITEISTPVIHVWSGILALPIIGTLDSARTQVVMENLLQEIVETGSVIAILDISGVPAVDSLVAQHLIKTVSATRLMGAECIISGIRPEIAQTVVHLGIDLSTIITKATLASALQTAFGMLKLEVRKRGVVNHLQVEAHG
jgi:rsbT co-antagonist protein RsbR